MPLQKGDLPDDWQATDFDVSTFFKNKFFSGVNFSGLVLVGADFSGSTLHGCDLSNCDLSYANFEHADVYRSRFRRSVLYAARFGDTNLTRCDFTEAYIYGLKVLDFCNVTYARFAEFRLEDRRRESIVVSSERKSLRHRRTGDPTEETASLCRSDYQSNGIVFSFEDFRPAEQAAQRSQVYNRLKRLYTANGFNEEARYCLYWERYHRTRSWYLYHQFPEELTGRGEFTDIFRRIGATITAYIFEKTAGYGLRPKIVLRNMGLVYLLYLAVVLPILSSSFASGVTYIAVASGRTLAPVTANTSLHADIQDLPRVAFFCATSMFSSSSQYFQPYGHLVWISSCFGVVGLALLALLITALYSVMRSD